MTYIVEPGDNIAIIAKKYGIRVVDLVKENHLENVYYLVPGLELIIPNKENQGTNFYLEEYVVKEGDTLESVGKNYGIQPDILAQINGLEEKEYLYPDQKILVPKDGVSLYITKENDTLDQVSSELGMQVSDILAYNDHLYLLPEQLIIYPNFK